MMKRITNAMLSCALLSMALAQTANAQNETLKVNQVGYFAAQEKTAVIEESCAEAKMEKVKIVNKQNGKVVWKGRPARQATSDISQKVRRIIDFSALTAPGEYQIVAGDAKADIVIADAPFAELSKAAIKAFYYQRMSMPIEEEYAGKWHRPAGHMDNEVYVHPSAATKERPAGTVISSAKGWYDAGDYNKYIVNSGFSIGMMLSAYEQNKAYYADLNINIPESKNNAPDILDEIYYNIQWMQTMQDSDGGLYHKLTTPNFEGFVAPADCHQKRYVVQKTTAASLDFAASMAMASRCYAEYESTFPGFAKTAIEQAEKAYAWAKANPNIPYNQNEMNKKYDPDVTTGAYDDQHFEDEFFWAATELYFTTGKAQYREDALKYLPSRYTPASWGNVYGLGITEWILRKNLTMSDENVAKNLRPMLIDYLKPMVEAAETSCYQSPYGNTARDFFWGCNSAGCCQRGLDMLYAYTITGEEIYKVNALRTVNNLLGENATGYCYVTGFGTKPTSHPHHRLSASNPNGALPGFLAGGPNPGQQDKNDSLVYPTSIADESYLDNADSYASNEIAINWNATLVALVGWIDSLK